VLIAKGTTAKKILNTTSELESIPITHIKDILDNYNGNPVIQKVSLLDLLLLLNNQGHQPTVGAARFANETNSDSPTVSDLKIEGAAAFKGDKLIGWLTPTQITGLQYLDNKVESGIINVPVPNEKNKSVSIERVDSLCKMKVITTNDHLKILIEINAEGNIGGQQGYVNLATPEMLEVLASYCEDAIESKLSDLINVAQNEYQSDILGFGEVIRSQQLDMWKQVKDDWEDLFPTIQVETKINFKIVRSGLTSAPIQIK